ncbi:MAG: hypothetical protein IPQ02_11510 [Saprospiraceae bacterium]|nr:hypothetical protein [Candidatus Defluviibacterium haderslevense]
MGIGQKLKHIIGNQPIAIILFILLLPYYSIAQLSSETLDTLDQLFNNGKYIEYLEKIIKIEKSIKNGENILCQSKQIKFDQGILSNSNGLVAIFLRYKQLDSAKFYLSKSEIKLSLIKNEKKYLEYKSDFEDKKSQYYELINDNKNCLTWTKKSIESLKTFNKDNPNIRGIAKSYRRYGSMF